MTDREKAIEAGFDEFVLSKDASVQKFGKPYVCDGRVVYDFDKLTSNTDLQGIFKAGAEWQAKQDAAEIKLLEIENEGLRKGEGSTLSIMVLAEIREITGVGTKPMLSQLPDAIRQSLKGATS